MHLKIHRDITKLIKVKKQNFNPFIGGPKPIDTHINNMSNLGTWGTQVELIPASTFFKCPFASKSKNSLEKILPNFSKQFGAHRYTGERTLNLPT